MRQDLAIYATEDFRQLEALYQSANRNLGGPEAKAILQRVVTEFPKSNRAGSAVLYLAQLSSGTEREAYLKSAIEAHGDTWYGDGVQVGALARVQLASLYAADGRLADAKALAQGSRGQLPGCSRPRRTAACGDTPQPGATVTGSRRKSRLPSA